MLAHSCIIFLEIMREHSLWSPVPTKHCQYNNVRSINSTGSNKTSIDRHVLFVAGDIVTVNQNTVCNVFLTPQLTARGGGYRTVEGRTKKHLTAQFNYPWNNIDTHQICAHVWSMLIRRYFSGDRKRCIEALQSLWPVFWILGAFGLFARDVETRFV